jgi:hypothetical protein
MMKNPTHKMSDTNPVMITANDFKTLIIDTFEQVQHVEKNVHKITDKSSFDYGFHEVVGKVFAAFHVHIDIGNNKDSEQNDLSEKGHSFGHTSFQTGSADIVEFPQVTPRHHQHHQHHHHHHHHQHHHRTFSAGPPLPVA